MKFNASKKNDPECYQSSADYFKTMLSKIFRQILQLMCGISGTLAISSIHLHKKGSIRLLKTSCVLSK